MPDTASTKLTTFCKQCYNPFEHWPSLAPSFCSRSCYEKWRSRPDRIWELVNKTESCWLWTGGNGGKSKSGDYGIYNGPNGRTSAHRVIWELLRGPIPEGMELCHDCPGGDNPACVNPDHHFIGTHRDNAANMVLKNRQAKGEQCGGAKLKEENIREIRGFPKTIGNRKIGKMFGVNRITIWRIRSGEAWKHIT